MSLARALRTTCLLAVGLLPMACARQPQPAPLSGMGGMSAMPGMTMGGMKTTDMAGMDMPAMMRHCAQMRQETSRGTPPAPDMRTMMAQCDRMDRDMAKGAPAPAATLSR